LGHLLVILTIVESQIVDAGLQLYGLIISLFIHAPTDSCYNIQCGCVILYSVIVFLELKLGHLVVILTAVESTNSGCRSPALRLDCFLLPSGTI
jgi:hypothetical protein